jgi:hypothetical protein
VRALYFVTKIVLTYCEKNCSSDREKLLEFKAECQEFANFLRSLEHFTQKVKGQNNLLVIEWGFLKLSWIQIQINSNWKNHWDLETCRKR